MKKLSLSFFLMNIVLLFAVISLIFAVFELSGLLFLLELMLLLAFVFVSVFSMLALYKNKRFGWHLLGAAFILLFFNAFLISALGKRFGFSHLAIVFFSAIGLMIVSLSFRGKQEYKALKEEQKPDYRLYIDSMNAEEEVKEEHKIEKTFTPGKFVASKKANKFHSPKCDWAKRISKSNQIWFNSEEEAEKQEFVKDKCVG